MRRTGGIPLLTKQALSAVTSVAALSPGRFDAFDAATARASASVPVPKASNSNTPTGPFQTTVPASAISAA